MPRKKTAPTSDAARVEPKPIQPNKPRPVDKAAKAKDKYDGVPSIVLRDREYMGEALLPIVERDGPILLALARESFITLNKSEVRFFRNLGIVDYGSNIPKHSDKTRMLRAKCLSWVLQDRRAIRLLTSMGIAVFGANIIGQIYLKHCRAGLRLKLDGCRIDSPPMLQDAHLALLSLQGSNCPGLEADRMQVDGGVFLRSGSEFVGEVRLPGAKIGGDLSCEGSVFRNPGGQSLNLNGLKIMGSIILSDKAQFMGGILFLDAEVGEILDCGGSTFNNPGGFALSADRIKVKGGVFLNDKAEFNGAVRLLGANIGGDLVCIGSKFHNSGGNALHGDALKVAGSVYLNGSAEFFGEVRLLGADIGGDLACVYSSFHNNGGDALSADGFKVAGSIFMCNDVECVGTVRFVGAKVGGNIECDSIKLYNPDGMVLYASGIYVEGSVFLRGGCLLKGMVSLTNAVIIGNLHLHEVVAEEAFSLRCSHARAGVLWDTADSWPGKGKLWLDGFHYDRLFEKAEWGLGERLGWLERHINTDQFNPQPYEQLSKVYREAGHEREAREVLIAKHERRLEERKVCLPCLPGWRKMRDTWPGWPHSVHTIWPWLCTSLAVWLGRIWAPCRGVLTYWLIWLFGKLCAFGYKPWRAAAWWFGLWFITWPLVSLMAVGEWLLPTMVDQQAGTTSVISFTSSGFSFDLLTPIFDMGYLAAWTPANNWAALILLTVGTFGYILVALFAASITGLIRK